MYLKCVDNNRIYDARLFKLNIQLENCHIPQNKTHDTDTIKSIRNYKVEFFQSNQTIEKKELIEHKTVSHTATY